MHAFLENHGDVWELTLVTLDKPYLFSNVSGVLSSFGMNIYRGQAMTTPDGLVLDVFEFSDEEGFLRQNPAATSDICRRLERAVAGFIDVQALLSGRVRSTLNRRRQRRPPVVHFDNEHSRKFTVLEIVADDAPGLLYRISRVISRPGVRRRARAHRHRRQAGHRRPARHEGRRQVVRARSGRAQRGSSNGYWRPAMTPAEAGSRCRSPVNRVSP